MVASWRPTPRSWSTFLLPVTRAEGRSSLGLLRCGIDCTSHDEMPLRIHVHHIAVNESHSQKPVTMLQTNKYRYLFIIVSHTSACLPEYVIPRARFHSPARRILTYHWPLFSALCDMCDNDRELGNKLSALFAFA